MQTKMPKSDPQQEVASKELHRRVRLRLLRMHYESGVGHLGGNLSALDLLLTLHHRVMEKDDLFVLSKGHAAGALYVTLWSLGRLSEEELLQFHKDHTRLAGHPPADAIPEILFATGSLGHGLGLSVGLGLGKRLRGQPGRIFCLMSDGEWNEGSSWEALIFLAHHRLAAVVPIIDLNGLQGFGTTTEVADLGSLADKLRSFGLEVREVDGHDPEAIRRALQVDTPAQPTAVVARTIKGHGVSFMENRMEWHYLPLSAEQYALAVEEAKRL
jgi:Transketolase, N-terminal subunit